MPELPNRDRIAQVGRWLSDKFPAPYPVDVRLCKKIAVEFPRRASKLEKKRGDDGITYRAGRLIVIRLSTWGGCRRSLLIHNLIHEWAHACSMRHDAIEHKRAGHDEEWAIAYGRIYRGFFDDGGCDESLGF